MGKFNEATRVQMPAMVHLTRLGYSYFGKISEEMAGKVYDPDTNILIDVFKKQFEYLNPSSKGEFNNIMRSIRQELDNDDLGKSFYRRLTTVSPIKLIDFENPQNNKFHLRQNLLARMVKMSSALTSRCLSMDCLFASWRSRNPTIMVVLWLKVSE